MFIHSSLLHLFRHTTCRHRTPISTAKSCMCFSPRVLCCDTETNYFFLFRQLRRRSPANPNVRFQIAGFVKKMSRPILRSGQSLSRIGKTRSGSNLMMELPFRAILLAMTLLAMHLKVRVTY